MSEDNQAEMTSSCCASCGIAQVDEVKLKECADCDLVKYCSDECKKNHKPQHERACKKRAAELHDEILFQQPESTHLGDCPICCLPIPIDLECVLICCSKLICEGCAHANKMSEAEASLDPSCPICQESLTFTADEFEKFKIKRIEANDPVSVRHKGVEQAQKGDYESAFEWYAKAAELGDVEAHYQLAVLYQFGRGVEKDTQKEVHHLELAAIGGHPSARYDLGCEEWDNNDWDNNDNAERAVKHWIIAAALGDDSSIEFMTEMSEEGYVSKDDLDTALRAHQAAVDAAKSPQREAAKEYIRAAELRDEILFKQPESSHRGDCPICCLPLQLDKQKSCMKSCCSKVICNGCNYANQVREAERRLKKSCPFCREPVPTTKEEHDKHRMKRVEANDPVAMCQEGFEQYRKGDYNSAFEYSKKAAELGNVDAHFMLATMYLDGQGVEKDEKKRIHHTEVAAIGGHPRARHNLGVHEERNGDMKRAVRHLIIAATQGSDESIKSLMSAFKIGKVSKDDLAAALRAHQTAVDETKSPQREAAEEFFSNKDDVIDM
eukprot:scaffold15187_cov75-Skeletonema_dohrnii-CCMP3373.AAC.1